MFTELKKTLISPLAAFLYACLLILMIVECLGIYPTARDYQQDVDSLNAALNSGWLNTETDLNSYLSFYRSDITILFPRAEQAVSYYESLNSSIEVIEKKQNSRLFSDPADQAALAEQRAYLEYARSLDIRFVNDIPFLFFTQSALAINVFLLAATIILAGRILIQDQDTDFLPLYATSATGIHKLFLQKFITLLFFTISMFAVVFLMQAVFMHSLGLALDTPVQLIYGYKDTFTHLDAYTYLFLTMVIGMLTVLLMVGGYLLLRQISGHTVFAFTITGIFLLAEYLSFHFISIASPLAYLKKWNVFPLLGAKSAGVYEDAFAIWSLAGLPAAVIIVFSAFAFLYLRQGKTAKTLLLRRHLRLHITNIFLREMHDAMIVKKGLLVFLLLAGYHLYDIRSYTVTESSRQRQLNSERSRYYGPLNENTIAGLTAEKARIDDASVRINALQEHIMNNTLTEEEQAMVAQYSYDASRKDAFETVYEEIMDIYQSKGTVYQNTEAVKLWLQTDSQLYRAVLYAMTVIPVLLLSAILGQNRYHSMIAVLAETSRKKKTYAFFILLIAAINILTVIFIVYGGRYMKFTKYMDITIIKAPVNQYFPIESEMDIRLYLTLFFVNQFIFLMALSSATILLSKQLSFTPAFLSAAITAALLYAIFNPFLSPLFLQSKLYTAAIFIVTAVCTAWSCSRIHT
ncbi:MAG: hypothetical protein IKD69_09280 [Solobacterium sp.]|nr:hypothetical protein [Solobacterium sp.]